MLRLGLAASLAALTATFLAVSGPSPVGEEERLAANTIRESQLRADIRYLSSDLLEGRAPGTRGDRLAREYIASRFEAIGLEPTGSAGFEQPVELVAVSAEPASARVSRGTETVTLAAGDEFVAWSGRLDGEVALERAEVVFVGYGIQAPEHAWDDYKDVDVRGKVVLVMNNDPESDPQLFAGKRRLYYGRWDYKYETAAKRGAAGAILIHTTPSAGYNWTVVRNSFSGERLALPPEPGAEPLRLEAWASEEACRRLARLAGHDLDALRAKAETRAFRPVPLGATLDVVLRNTVVRRTSANVIGRLPGSDAELAREAVLYTAHHDHYGVKTSPSGEPLVWNGARDNAAGVATMLSVAEAFAALPRRPRRTILFASVTGEEQGLLGSRYLASHLPLPAGRVAANVNIDGAAIWGRTHDVPVIGLGKSSLDDWLRAIAETQGRKVVDERFPENGSYYRSDHLSFARVGIPAAYIDAGTDVVGRPPGWGRAQKREWEEANYHQPTDDFTSDWKLDGVVEDARLLFLLGAKVAEAPTAPTWRPGDEFEAARKRALAELDRR